MNKSIVLASLVAAVALAACGKKEEAPAEASVKPRQATSKPAEEKAEPKEAKKEAKKAGSAVAQRKG